jgi:hypothetical protein
MRNQVSLRRRQASRVRFFQIGAIALVAIFAAVLGAAVCQGATSQDLGLTSMGALPFLGFGGLMFFSPDSGGGSSSSASTASPSEPKGGTIELKLADSIKIAGDYFKQLGGAMQERDQAVGETAGLKKKVTDLTAERDTLTGQVTALTTERDGLKTTVTGLTTERDTAKSRVTLIESFCKGNGLDLAGLEKFQAVKEVPGSGPQSGDKDGKALYDEWQKLKDSGQGKKATAFFRKHKDAMKEYAGNQNG